MKALSILTSYVPASIKNRYAVLANESELTISGLACVALAEKIEELEDRYRLTQPYDRRRKERSQKD